MGTIPQELLNFKTIVEPGLPSMKSTSDNIKSKVGDLLNANKEASDGLDANYKSENKSNVMSKFTSMDGLINTVKSSVSSVLDTALSESEGLIGMVNELETINEEIAAQEAIISNADKEDENTYYSIVSNARSIISKKNTEFTTKCNDAIKKLAALKALDTSLSTGNSSASTLSTSDLSNLKYGSFDLYKYTASNGEVLEYYLYVPDYGKEVEGLPVMLYMHGGGNNTKMKASSAIQYGLSSYIAKQEITPEGMVIVPVIRNFNDKGVAALKELTDHVVETYKCDTNRISVSGHSYGGMTAYKLVNQNPGYFSAVVGISGSQNVTDAFKGVKVWEFTGTYENGEGPTSYGACTNAVKKINNVGGYAYITALKTGHSGTNKLTYEKEHLSPDGDWVNPLTWAFRQVKGKA